MAHCKIGLAVIVGFFSLTCHGQGNPLIYGGVDYFRNTGYVENSYGNLQAGAQLFRWKFIAPEVGYEYHFGRLRDNNELHPEEPNARAPSKLLARFSSHTLSVAPKVIVGNEEAAFVFIPQYNIGNINARGELLKDVGRDYTLTEHQQVANSISFWSFAAGVEGQFFDSDFVHFSLLLKYHLLNTENILKEIDLENTNLKTPEGNAEGIGVSFRVYVDLLQLLKKDP